MDVRGALKRRISTRAFLDKPVSMETVKRILDAARWAPSGVNMQPWHVIAVTGETKKRLSEALVKMRLDGVEQNPDYDYYPSHWEEPYASRRKACGLALYKALKISKEDKERRLKAWIANYSFFGAPVGLLFYIDKGLAPGTIMDMGIFLQSVMLAAEDMGLSTCPQASLAEYPDVVREILNIPDSKAILCGMSLGYGDGDHPVNNYRTEREPVESFLKWLD